MGGFLRIIGKKTTAFIIKATRKNFLSKLLPFIHNTSLLVVCAPQKNLLPRYALFHVVVFELAQYMKKPLLLEVNFTPLETQP